MSNSEKILQLLHSNDEKNIALAITLAESAAKNGLDTDFVVHALFRRHLSLCFQNGWMLQYITEFYADEYDLRFSYIIKSQRFEYALELTDDAIDVCETMDEGMAQMHNLEKLKYVTLYPKHRMEFDFDFSHLQALKVIHLECLDIDHIPADVVQLNKLEELNIINCRLSRIPPELGKLNCLKKMNLLGNGRWEFQENPQLHEIYSPLEALPDALGDLKNLEELILDNNGLTELPNTLRNLESLKVLSLKSNRIKILPESIKALVNLDKLELSGNPLPKSMQAVVKQWLPNCKITF
ncbi:hypothetical protein BKI52_04970 [marine bacterium AO1-C]|nr:hypothetical protein BKI52_04970 [marine bacterium AO1-C]